MPQKVKCWPTNVFRRNYPKPSFETVMGSKWSVTTWVGDKGHWYPREDVASRRDINAVHCSIWAATDIPHKELVNHTTCCCACSVESVVLEVDCCNHRPHSRAVLPPLNYWHLAPLSTALHWPALFPWCSYTCGSASNSVKATYVPSLAHRPILVHTSYMAGDGRMDA